MNRFMLIMLVLLAGSACVNAGDVSLQAGSGVYSETLYNAPIYLGGTYYFGYLGNTLLKPALDIGYWRAERPHLTTNSFFYAPISIPPSVSTGVYAGPKLTVDMERRARETGDHVWPALGIGTLVQTQQGEGPQFRLAGFGRLSSVISNKTSFFIELEGQTEIFENGVKKSPGLGFIAKAGLKLTVF